MTSNLQQQNNDENSNVNDTNVNDTNVKDTNLNDISVNDTNVNNSNIDKPDNLSVNSNPDDSLKQLFNSINKPGLEKLNPIAIITFLIVILIFYFIFSILGTNHNTIVYGESSGMKFMELLFWGLFVFLILVNGLQYFFNLDFKSSINNIFTDKPELDINVGGKNWIDDVKDSDNSNEDAVKLANDICKSLDGVDKEQCILNNLNKSINKDKNKNTQYVGRNEVFHIGNNKYTYKQADAICKAYGGDLANYKQIETAYKNGAEWCGYGWSKNQLALFPTQITTWKRLRNIKGHEHSCGRPGINGGYISNPNARFGVNCYGKKPDMTNDDMMNLANSTPYPKTKEERNMEKLVDHYRSNMHDLQVMPFNYNKWNRV